MSILISGDFHANAGNEIHYITKRSLVSKFGYSKFESVKYHVILGDGGFLWPGNHRTDRYNYEVLANRPFPVLCVPGNHEPILGITSFPEVNIGIGEPVIQINDNPFIAYFKRGKVYSFDGFKFLVLGGALSIDKHIRKPGISWWEKEYWTEQEKEDIFELIKKDNEFDYVLSHTGPHSVNKKLFLYGETPFSEKFEDEVAFMNDQIDRMIKCRQWWCGHWHRESYYYDKVLKRGYHYLYKEPKIISLEGQIYE